jgi:potassium efflux system protein
MHRAVTFARLRPRSVFVAFLLLVATGSYPAAVLADAAGEAGGLSPAALEARIAALSETVDAEGAGAAPRAELEQARAALARQDSLRTRLDELERLRREGPKLLESTRRQLSDEQGDPDEPLPDGISLDRLEEEASRTQAALDGARSGLAVAQRKLADISDRRLYLPKLLADAKASVATIETGLALGQPSEDASLSARVEHVRDLALLEARRLEQQVAQVELDTYDLRRELFAARRDLRARESSYYEARLAHLQEALGNQRNVEGMQALEDARSDERTWAGLDPELSAIAARNVALAERRTGRDGLAARIEETERSSTRARQKLVDLSEAFSTVRDKAEVLGFTDTIGLILRKERAALPDVDRRRAAIRDRGREIAAVQLELFELEAERRDLASIDARARRLAAGAADELKRQELTAAAGALLLAQRGLLDTLISDQEAYFGALVDLDAAERELVASTLAYRDYIDEHVLWIRSASFPSLLDPAACAAALVWLGDPDNLAAAGNTFVRVTWLRPFSALLGLLVVLVLLVYRGRAARAAREISSNRGRERGGPVIGALFALVAAGWAAAAWPALLHFVAWVLISGAATGDSYSRAIAHGLESVAGPFFTFELARQILCKGSIARAFFGWPGKALDVARIALASSMAAALPLLFIAAVFHAHTVEAWNDSLGRACYVAALLVFAVGLRRALAPDTALTQAAIRRMVASGSRRLAQHGGALGPGLAVLLALATVAGFYFTTRDLGERLHATLRLVAVLGIANGLALRWLALARGRLARKTAEQRRAAQGKSEAQGSGEAGVVVETEPDLSSVGSQTRQLLRSGLGVALVVGLWFVWADVFPAFRVLDNVEIWHVEAESGLPTSVAGADAPGEEGGAIQGASPGPASDVVSVTLGDLGAAVVVLVLTVIAARNLPGFLELAVLPGTGLAPGVRYAVTSVARYSIAIVGAVATFSALGIRWANIQWLVAAMTVGLGFGLQEIFANFVSGLIILFERPIRVGDTVTLGEVTGTVTRIRIRATTLLDWDRKELVVPNKEFITGQLINWTLSDPLIRVRIVVGIAYGSDTELAERLLYAAAKECPLVLEEPQASVLFDQFGDNSLTFTLRCFISGLESYWQAQHALHMLVDRKFRAAGVEIAFPQRDLHLRSVAEAVPVRILGEAPEATGPA